MDVKTMNDSGVVIDDKISFDMKIKLNKNSSELTLVTFHGRPAESLADVIKREFANMKLEYLIFFATVQKCKGPRSVNPFLLPCGFIEPDTEVEWEEQTESIYDYKFKPSSLESKSYSKLFCIDMQNSSRKNRPSITYVHYQKFGGRDLCVLAQADQSFAEALMQDGRFKSVERFKLHLKLKRGEGPVSRVTSVVANSLSDSDEVATYKVSVSKDSHTSGTFSKSQENKIDHGTSLPSASSGAAAATTVAKMRPIIKEKSKLFQELMEEGVLCKYSKKPEDLTYEEELSEMKACVLAHAWSTLVGPKDRGGDKFIKAIGKIGEVQFANEQILSRPVLFTKKISSLYNSVGYLECGSVVATCFLISEYIIVTNYHVIDMIERARTASTHADHATAYVFFEYEEPGHLHRSNGFKLLPFRSTGNILCSSLDYAFLCLEDRVDYEGLAKYISCDVPTKGKVCIVGHPFGQEKQDELCPILPRHEDRWSLRVARRLKEKEEQCESNPANCTRENADNICVHLYHNSIGKLLGNKSCVTYDVGSMFEGSSGAPVFNMKGRIFALHSRGYRLNSSSILEVGITFKAIIDHLNRSGRSEFVEEHFPQFTRADEPMDVDY